MSIEEENENLKRALLECHVLLAAIIKKHGGEISLSYSNFYEISKAKNKYEFHKHEDYQNNSIVFKLLEKKD